MRTHEKPTGWAVDLRIHSASGLPTSDPIVALKVNASTVPLSFQPLCSVYRLTYYSNFFVYRQVTFAGEKECRWSTAAYTSISGTAYIGAWTTLLLHNSTELNLELREKAPILSNLRGGVFAATSTLDLSDLSL